MNRGETILGFWVKIIMAKIIVINNIIKLIASGLKINHLNAQKLKLVSLNDLFYFTMLNIKAIMRI